MEPMMIDGVEFTANEPITEEEARAYVSDFRNRHSEVQLATMHIDFDGDYANITYTAKPQRFDRIRRITGYLVGTLDRFNDGKRAEESDRVKHGVGCGCC